MSIFKEGVTIIISSHGPGRNRSLRISPLGAKVVVAFLIFFCALVVYLILIYGRVYYLAIQSSQYRRMNEEMKISMAKLSKIRENLKVSESYRKKILNLLGVEKTPPPVSIEEALIEESKEEEALTVGVRRDVPSILPVRGFISRGFSLEHPGIDIAAPEGTPVLAPADGYVRDVGWDSIYGDYLVIEHGSYTTFFGHLYQNVVRIGEEVSIGKVIGYVGSTGVSSSPHLHYEVRLKGEPVDPRTYFLQ